MARILVPYHTDELLAELDIPLAPDVTVTVDPPPDTDPWTVMATLYGQVAELVAADVRRGARPVVLSGDCTTALGVVAGLQRGGLDPSLVWLDAHGDLQSPETSTSGYLGGMPLRLLLGHRAELIAEPLGLRPVPQQRVALIGVRELDPPEHEYLLASDVRQADVARFSVEVLPPGPIYLHFDVDVVDPEQLPGLRYPVPDGPGVSEVADVLAAVLATGRVVALGIGCTWHTMGSAAPVRARLTELLAGWE